MLDWYRGVGLRQRLHRVAWDERLAEWKGDRAELDAALEARGLDGMGRQAARRSTSARRSRRAGRCGTCLNATLDVVPGLLAGGADLTENTGTELKDEKRQSAEAPVGRQIRFGIREHGMGGIMVGMARHGGVLPVGGTFFVFSDYMRGSVRLAALSKAKCIFVWTHDSVGLGEDGPTHQPIEQLASLRAMPGLRVIRPADANETAQAWRIAVDSRGPDRADPHPPERPGARRHGRRRGRARRVRAVRGAPPTARARAHRHRQRGRRSASTRPPIAAARRASRVRVVSMPSWDLFAAQPQSYRDAVLPPAVPVAVGRGRRRRSDGSATPTRRSASIASVRRRRARRSSIELGINPAHVAERGTSAARKGADVMNRLHALFDEQGQSPWLDNLKRGYLTSGQLAKLVDDGIRGLTSNPTILQKAISGSADYDEQFKELAVDDHPVLDDYWALVIQDINDALDVFAPLYEASDGGDGFVSVEVAPDLARDTAGTIEAARYLHERIDRPNLLVKIPATAEGVPAIQQMISEGRNINVTLIFSLDRYAEVIEAYLSGLEACEGDLSRVASVASFFISRVDTEVDRRLEAIGTPDALAQRGKAAVAQGKLAYELFSEKFHGPRWEALVARGAKVQRPLWASTSTKNPAYPDTLYVDQLIGPDTVNTMPDQTIEAFDDHGTVARTVDVGVDEARRDWEALARLRHRRRRRRPGPRGGGRSSSFAKSFDELLTALQAKADEIAAQG